MAPNEMKALIKEEPKESYVLKEIPVPEPKPDEILFKVEKVLQYISILWYLWNSSENQLLGLQYFNNMTLILGGYLWFRYSSLFMECCCSDDRNFAFHSRWDSICYVLARVLVKLIIKVTTIIFSNFNSLCRARSRRCSCEGW